MGFNGWRPGFIRMNGQGSTGRPKPKVLQIHSIEQFSGRLDPGGIAIGCGFDQVLDGIVATSQVTTIASDNVLPWMSGIRWEFIPAGGGSWFILNQGLWDSALSAVAGKIALTRAVQGWPRPEQIWKIFRRVDRDECMLRNQAGGWLSMDQSSLTVLRREIDTSDRDLFWHLRDASGILRPLV